MRARGGLRTLALIGVAAIVAAGCTGGSGGGDKAGGGGAPVVLTMASGYDERTLQTEPAVADFIQRVEELSGGNVRIHLVDGWGNYQPGFEQQIVGDVKAGKADLAWVGTRIFDTLGVDSFQALTAPMLIDSYPLERAVMASDIPGEMLGSLSKLGVSGLAVLGDGLRKPIAVEGALLGPADWQGITFAALRSQGQAEAVAALGARSSDLWGSEALSGALANGELQGIEKNLPPYQVAVYASRFPFVTANVNLWPQTLALLANPARLSGLTDAQRGWLRRAAADASVRSTGLFEHEAAIIDDVCQKGARFANASEADLAALRQAFAPVYGTFEQDPQTKAFIDRIDALKRATLPGPALAIPTGCTGSTVTSVTDPLSGTWTTGPITSSQQIHAYIAAGGSEKDANEFWGGNKPGVDTITFQGGVFTEECGIYGQPLEVCNTATYEIGDDGIFELYTGCTETFRYDLSRDTLRIHLVKGVCVAHDYYDDAPVAPYSLFPFTRSR
jgi:TRAP-type C4-dicarboxylate transport system substrate-binding protein